MRKSRRPGGGPFRFLSLPIEVRFLILEFALHTVDDLISYYWFIPVLPRHHNAPLRASRQLRSESLAVLYAKPVHLHGLDLMDLARPDRMLRHDWFRDAVRPIHSLRVRLSLEGEEVFSGRWRTLLAALPGLQALRVDVKTEGEWACATATGSSIADTGEAVDREGFLHFLKEVANDGEVALEVHVSAAVTKTTPAVMVPPPFAVPFEALRGAERFIAEFDTRQIFLGWGLKPANKPPLTTEEADKSTSRVVVSGTTQPPIPAPTNNTGA